MTLFKDFFGLILDSKTQKSAGGYVDKLMWSKMNCPVTGNVKNTNRQMMKKCI